MPAGHLMNDGTEYPTQAVTRYSVTFPAVYIALIPYNLLALHNQNATQQLFDLQNQLRSNVAVIAEQVKER